MSRDPIDRFGARLFEEARRELPPQGAEQRALEAARRALPRPSALASIWRGVRPTTFLPWAAAFALVVGLVVFSHREPAPSSISREPLARPSQAHDSEPALTPQPSAPASASTDMRPPRAVAAPVRSRPSTLSDELELLRTAQTALAAGNTEVALQALDRYDNSLTGTKKLRAEATLLRAETLSRAGRAEAAAELARRFIAENPTSPLVDRARSFIHEGN